MKNKKKIRQNVMKSELMARTKRLWFDFSILDTSVLLLLCFLFWLKNFGHSAL